MVCLKEKLPEAHTDFIFAVAGEEFGFILCSIIVFIIFNNYYSYSPKIIKNKQSIYHYCYFRS